ncbi:hypothetical protein BOX15_Mlig018191g1 [Macrostomum lignano]|uniref:Sulfotransferase domain-containing protein n=1 Tax=Macrostomum lignano TaxID=282301 RepID=A0A267EUX3_9PLAT|nr:hypothetical protein BOX15_Mlig018191g1 [Macrostomum lignano]
MVIPIPCAVAVVGILHQTCTTKSPLMHTSPALMPQSALAAMVESEAQEEEEEDIRVRRLPQAIVIGARKCGTRALLDFLEVHPRVRAARGEVHYFDREERHNLGLSWYRGQMPLSRPGDVTLEKSPAYFVTEAAPARVWRMNTSIQLILILRDPVARVVSDYAQHVHRRVSKDLPPKPIESLVLTRNGDGRVNPNAKMVQTSLYHRHLRRWLRYFKPDQIHLVDGDRLVSQPHSELQQVEDFLGLKRHIRPEHFVFNATKGFYCLAPSVSSGRGKKRRQRCLGSEKGRRHPSVANSTLTALRHFFAGHDERLVQLTGRTFDWMRRNAQQFGEE